MSAATAITEPARASRLSTPLSDLCLAAAITLFVFATYAAGGFPTLDSAGGDNDSMLRLVEVRDLLGGQGWYDLHQYRMGPAGGFLMHWSRLVDAPIAGLMLLASAFGAGQGLAEAFALVVWPALMMTAVLFGLIQLGRSLGSEHAVFPAAALGAGAIYFTGIFRPGSIDHHNLQVAICVLMLLLLIRAPQHRGFSAIAGLCAAVMLAIGMEAAPYVAAAGLCVALSFLIRGDVEAKRTAAFGAAFAGGTLLAFLATVGPAQWSLTYCDALSNVQLAMAAAGGLGLAGVAALPFAGRTFGRRLGALAVLAVGCAAVARFGFPQCLADPYAGVDPRVREFWLDFVAEAQSVFDLARNDWTKILVYYATPAIALAVFTALTIRDGLTRERLLYGAFLLATFLVACWQVRGAFFSVPLATTALALGVGELRQRAAASPSAGRSIALLVAWLLSFNLLWSVAGNAMSARAKAERVAVAAGLPDCPVKSNFAYLSTLPAGTVLAVSDLGTPILVTTPHRVLSGPYHRNIAGNLAMLDMMLGTSAEAERLARQHGVDYVAICRGNPETKNFSTLAPRGLMADLVANRIPGWLQLDAGTRGAPVEIFKVAR